MRTDFFHDAIAEKMKKHKNLYIWSQYHHLNLFHPVVFRAATKYFPILKVGFGLG